MQSRANTYSNAVTENVNTSVNDSFGNRRAHLNDDVLASKLPDRTWNEFFGEGVRKAGLGAAMLGASLGVSGLGGIADKRAEAGIAISSDPNADQRAKDNGFDFSVQGGGNVGSLSVFSELGAFYSSLVFVNPYTAISAAHQFDSRFGMNQSYSVGAGANYNSGPSFVPSNIVIHPGYGGTPGAGTDLAVINFNIPVPLQQNLTIASGSPVTGENAWLSGFGKPGNRTIGELPQDGFIRAGTSSVRSTVPLLGDPVNYRNMLFVDSASFPTAMRGTTGDSGGGVFSQGLDLYGLIVGGSSSLAGSTTTFLDVTIPTQRDFITANTWTGVPEPSSLVMGLLAGGAGILWTRFRRKPVQ